MTEDVRNTTGDLCNIRFSRAGDGILLFDFTEIQTKSAPPRGGSLE